MQISTDAEIQDKQYQEGVEDGKKEAKQKTFDIMKANSTCRHEGHPLRLCYAKSVVGIECCLKNCVLFPKED